MKATLAFVLMVLAAACTSAPAADASTCPNIESVKTIPFRGEKGVDPAYDRLRFDASCESVLVEALDSTRKMPDPRQMAPYEAFVVGDAALFILLSRREIPIEKVLPEEVAARFQTEGVFAYFEYVASPSGRRSVVERVKALMAR